MRSLPRSLKADRVCHRTQARLAGRTPPGPCHRAAVIRMNDGAAANQPFTDPATRPSTIQRWIKT
jgi:hypothetical protein